MHFTTQSIFLLGAIPFLVIFILELVRIYNLSRKGISTTAQIMNVNRSFSSDRREYPELQFTTRKGETIRIKSRYSDNFSNYEIGQIIGILYHPDHPKKFVINDFAHKYFHVAVLGIVSIVLLAIGVKETFL